MSIFLTILHVFVCFVLVLIVLLQTGKGASIGAAFGGGSSQTLFGSRGAASFLGKVTTIAAIIYMLTSLTLAMISANKKDSIILEDKRTRQEMPATQGSPIEKVPPSQGPVQVPTSTPVK